MQEIAESLLRHGDKNAAPVFGNVFFRNFLPVSTNVKYDVVVASHSLSELSCEKERRRVIRKLWQKTNQFLVGV